MSMTSIESLFAEAERQLTICNACRYCEGYCAVFPALELRRSLTAGDITYLANLCHDCRDCYTACMYAPPHEFAVNPPAVLSAVRAASPSRLPAWSWRRGLLLAAPAAGLVVLLGLVGGSRGATAVSSPYRVLAYPALLAAAGLPALWGIAVMLAAAARCWRATAGPLRRLLDMRAWRGAIADAATMRNQRGAGAECAYPGDEPSPARRRLHALVAYGFLACLASTFAAAIMQDLAGDPPPYPPLSAPVLLGISGGAGLTAGSAGLLLLKRRAPADRADPAMTASDYGLLTALLALAVTGLLTLVLRHTAAFGPVLVVHLAAVVACFAVAPYSKFMHAVYRLLVLVQYRAERSAGPLTPPPSSPAGGPQTPAPASPPVGGPEPG